MSSSASLIARRRRAEVLPGETTGQGMGALEDTCDQLMLRTLPAMTTGLKRARSALPDAPLLETAAAPLASAIRTSTAALRVLSVRPLSAPGRPVAAVMPDTLAALGAR